MPDKNLVNKLIVHFFLSFCVFILTMSKKIHSKILVFQIIFYELFNQIASSSFTVVGIVQTGLVT